MAKARTSILKEGINQFMILSLCFCKADSAERAKIIQTLLHELDDMLIKLISQVLYLEMHDDVSVLEPNQACHNGHHGTVVRAEREDSQLQNMNCNAFFQSHDVH